MYHVNEYSLLLYVHVFIFYIVFLTRTGYPYLRCQDLSDAISSLDTFSFCSRQKHTF